MLELLWDACLFGALVGALHGTALFVLDEGMELYPRLVRVWRNYKRLKAKGE